MQVLGGRFSSALPSDILKPGAFAHVSLPARARPHGKEFAPLYGNSSELRQISGLMAKCAAAASISHITDSLGPYLLDPGPPKSRVLERVVNTGATDVRNISNVHAGLIGCIPTSP